MPNTWKYTLTIYRRTDGKYISMSGSYSDENTRVMGRYYRHFENEPKTIRIPVENGTTDATKNLLSSTCARWSASGTGAISKGDWVLYEFDYVNSIGTTARWFYGKITDFEGIGNDRESGVLTIVAESMMAIFASRKEHVNVYNSHVDYAIKDYTRDDGIRYLSGITESDIVQPFEDVGFAAVESRKNFGDDYALWTEVQGGKHKAQAFVANGDILLGIRFAWLSDAATELGDYTISLRQDNDNRPGAIIVSKTYTLTTDTGSGTADVSFITSNAPVQIEKGQRYWISITYGNSDGLVKVGFDAPLTGETIDVDASSDDGSAWTIVDDVNLYLYIDTADYESINEDLYTFVDGDNRLYLDGSVTAVSALSGPSYTYYRGRISYYHGTVTHQQICEAVMQRRAGLVIVPNAAQDRTFGYYSTRGRDHLDCMKELMDIFETSGTWSGYQHVMTDYLDGDPYSGTNKIKIGRRLALSESSFQTFTWGSGTDAHCRIISFNLSQKNERKLSGATIFGESSSGRPVPVTVTDQGLSGSLGESIFGLSRHLVQTSSDIKTRGDGLLAIQGHFDHEKTNVWEGSIVVAGLWPDLMHMTYADDTYGSGKIITLNISPLQISLTKFKVVGIICYDTTTEIFLNNRDIVVENRFRDATKLADKHESFLAPVGFAEDVYFWGFIDSVVTDATLYGAMETASGDVTGMQRVLCEKLTDTNRNAIIYCGMFEKWNGSTDGSTKIRYLKLYDAKSGGTLKATYDLYSAGPPIRDERFDKWHSQRLHFNLITKAS